MSTSTTDGKIYHMIICLCGRQNTLGICAHTKGVYVEALVPINGRYFPSATKWLDWGAVPPAKEK